jgi:hypothetical protein
MHFSDFKSSLTGSNPPAKISPYLDAMWFDGKNDWKKAHSIVQDLGDPLAAWIHAYLHRKEGDLGNAQYWYRQAGKNMPDYSLNREWGEIVQGLL